MSHLLCPSAQPDMEDSRLLGVVGGTPEAPELQYLEQYVPVTEALLASTAPARPLEVLRIAGRCEEKKCRHFDGSSCHLAMRIVQILPVVTKSLALCTIRPSCRWFQQEGKAACQRCPQIITYSVNPTAELSKAATP